MSDPFTSGTVSEEATTTYTQVTCKVAATDLTDADHNGFEKALDDGLTVEASGDALPEAEESSAGEAVGFLIAAVILFITLGSLVAVSLPLLTAIVGVGVSMTSITVLSSLFDLNSSTSALATMLGIAVGIDYALFIVSRYRSERAAGYDAREAAARANGTAGSAVVFAGLTVMIALVGLSVVNLPVLTSMGIAAAGAVAIAVLVAITLVPAMLGFAPERVRGRKRRAAKRAARKAASGQDQQPKTPLGQRWASFVIRRPVRVLVLAVLGLGVMALPATQLKLGMGDDGSQPTSTTQRKAYDMLADSFGPGFNGPLTIVVNASKAADTRATATEMSTEVAKLDDVASVGTASFNSAGDTAIIAVTPKSGPSTDATKDLVQDIRDLAGTTSTGSAETMVTGQTAVNIDISDKFSAALMPYLMLVVGLAFLVLMLVFRSILVPLKAALGFLLSVLASFGAVVAVFQWGWLKDLFGIEQTGPIMSLMPILTIGIVFGLAMDYQVFLVTRIREAYVHGDEPRQAIVSGFQHSSKVVVAAALIMIAVFGSFIASSEAVIKGLGFGLAVAVAFDAFVVRMTIVPAVLALLGQRAWALPAWIDRILPNVDIEGEKLAHQQVTPATPHTGHAADVAETDYDYSGRR